MAVALRGTPLSGFVSLGTISVSKPTGVVDNDVLIAFGISDATTFSAPTGWTLVDSTTNIVPSRLWIKVASSEPSSWTFTATAGNYGRVTVAAYSGVSTSTPQDATATKQATLNGGNVVIPALTTVTDNAFLVSIVGEVFGTNATGGFTFPSGWTIDIDEPGASNSRAAIAHLVKTPAGDTGTVTVLVADTFNARVGYLVALQPVSAIQLATAGGSDQSAGTAFATKVLNATASGFSGQSTFYDGNVLYDDLVPYELNLSLGTASATILPSGATSTITASGSTVSTGSAAALVIPVSGISATGTTISAGSALATIPTIYLTASGTTLSAGTAFLLVGYVAYASGLTQSTGTANAIRVGPMYIFEPPVAYDNPTTLPPPFPQIRNSYAKWQKGQRRGRTVLKNVVSTPGLQVPTTLYPGEDVYSSDNLFPGENPVDTSVTTITYVTVDTPTVDQINSAAMAYQGGHIYIINSDEATALKAAGYTVSSLLTPVGA